MIILSILIPTIPERVDKFTKLYNELHRQLEYMQSFHSSLGHIEILVNGDKRFLEGGPSIGDKCQELLMRAEGKYVVFIHDDDTVSPNYLETLVRLCQQDCDVVTFRSVSKLKNFWCVVDMSLRYQNDQASPDYMVRRKPWNICPIRSIYAKLYKFNDINYGEDWLWLEQVLKHCTTETHSEAILHQYNHGDHSESDKITQHELQSIERTGGNS